MSSGSHSGAGGEPPIDILLVGLGPVGAVYAYVLEQSQRCRVTAIARSLYLPIQAHGLTIQSKKHGTIPNWRPFRLLKSPQEANDRPYRFIICCVKCLPDLEPTSALLAPFLAPTIDQPNPPAVVLIQNGIGIEQPLAEAFPSIHIISCVTWTAANLILPSPASDKPIHHQLKPSPMPSSLAPIIVHGAQDRIAFGLYEGEGFSLDSVDHPHHGSHLGPCNRFVEGLLSSDRTPLLGPARDQRLRAGRELVNLLEQLLKAGNASSEAVDHIQPIRWTKNLWNATFSTMCTLSRTPVGQLVAPEVLPYTLPVIRRTMLEILYVGRALGYRENEFPAKSIDDTINFTIQFYQDRPEEPSSQASTTAHHHKAHLESNNAPGSDPSKDSQARSENVFEEDDEDEHDRQAGGDSHRSDRSTTFKPSMLIDFEMNRPMELEPIVGAVLDRARSKAVETPRLDMLYSVLKVLQEVAARQHAAKLNTQQQERHLHHWAMRKPSVGGSGTSDSRQAWLNEVKRRSNLGESADHATLLNEYTSEDRPLGNPPIPSKEHKVTGKPLA